MSSSDGGPAKAIYLFYDRFFGTAPTLGTAVRKMLCDVVFHGTFLIVPSFFLITGAVKGMSLEQIAAQCTPLPGAHTAPINPSCGSCRDG